MCLSFHYFALTEAHESMLRRAEHKEISWVMSVWSPALYGCTASVYAQSAADVDVRCPQAFKEARDAMADAAAKRPPSATAGDNQEVARVLRYFSYKTLPSMRLLLS